MCRVYSNIKSDVNHRLRVVNFVVLQVGFQNSIGLIKIFIAVEQTHSSEFIAASCFTPVHQGRISVANSLDQSHIFFRLRFHQLLCAIVLFTVVGLRFILVDMTSGTPHAQGNLAADHGQTRRSSDRLFQRQGRLF